MAAAAPAAHFVKVERYDANMMRSLISHDGIDVITKRALKAYHRRRTNGNQVQVIYEHGKALKDLKYGRVYPQRGLGFQSFPHEIRNCLASKYYWDLDMVNAQPVILLQLCSKNGWKCDLLRDYVDNRSAHLSNIMDETGYNRDEAKTLCLSIIFGARPKHCPAFLNDLSVELLTIGVNISRAYPDIFKLCSKATNPIFSCVSHVCQDIEWMLLRAIESALIKNGRSMDTYIHDGGLVSRLVDEVEFPHALISQLEQDVFSQTGYRIKLAIKPMVNSFKFRDDLYRIGGADNNGVLEAEYQKRKDEFEETHFYCIETDTIVDHSRVELQHTSRNAASVALATYNFRREHDSKVYIHDFVSEWLKDSEKRTIRKFVFQPNLAAEIAADEYNLFGGFASSHYTDSIAEEEAIVERFKLLVAVNGKEPIMTDYMTKWFALAVQKPHIAPGVALVLINNNQGSGKDTLTDFFGKKVIGKDYFCNIKNVEEELFDSHSTAFDGTLFMKLEEVNGSQNRKFSDMLKSIITAPTATINPKGMKKYTIDAFPHIVMTTNNSVPVKVEPSDRRFCISYTSSEYVGNREFWNETYRLFELPHSGAAVYRYLMGLDLSDFNVRDFPRTAYHESLAASEEPSEVAFIKQYEPFTDLTSGDLWTPYANYCRENLITPKKPIHFGRCMTPLVESGILTSRILTGKPRYSKAS